LNTSLIFVWKSTGLELVVVTVYHLQKKANMEILIY